MLIIYAHPNKKGHCGYMLEQIEKELTERKLSYALLDLYAMKYDPVMHNNEHYTSGGYDKSETTLSIQKKIEKSKHLIFIYPTWWNGPPAILKGFFDKILTGRWAYKYVNGRPVGLLKGKKATVLTTTASPRFLGWLYLMDISLRQVTFYTLRFCGIKTKSYAVGGCRALNDKQKKKIRKKVLTAISAI